MKNSKIIPPAVAGRIFGSVGGVLIGLAIEWTPWSRGNMSSPGSLDDPTLCCDLGALAGWVAGCRSGFRSG